MGGAKPKVGDVGGKMTTINLLWHLTCDTSFKKGYKNQMRNLLNIFLQYYNASIQNKGQHRSQRRIIAAKALVFELLEKKFSNLCFSGIRILKQGAII